MKTKDKVYSGLLVGFFLALVAIVGNETTDKIWPVVVGIFAGLTLLFSGIAFAELRPDR